MGNALRAAAASDSPLFAVTRERILGALRLLLDAVAVAGTLRADVDPKDVMRLINGIWYLPDGPEWRDDVGRMLGLVIDGLRWRAAASGTDPHGVGRYLGPRHATRPRARLRPRGAAHGRGTSTPRPASWSPAADGSGLVSGRVPKGDAASQNAVDYRLSSPPSTVRRRRGPGPVVGTRRRSG